MANVALLATVADSAASQAAGAVSPLMPSGVVLPFAGSTSPAGWLACDGTAYNQADYPALFAALGTTYNTQVNPTTGSAWAAPSAGQFRVPDMRGLFLRGEGTASGGDAVSVGGHQVGKTAKNGISAAASSVSGSVGGSDGTHTHGTGYADTNAATSGSSTNLMTFHQSNSNNVLGPRTDAGTIVKSNNSGHGHSFSQTAAAQTITGDNETRPANRGVRYIIKV